MLTLFTTAKAFVGHSRIIQRNALKSWTLLHPNAEVILFGDDQGAAEASAELGLRHEPHVERHQSGMKYLDYMFARAQQISRHNLLCYCNCDILLGDDFARALTIAANWRPQFLMIGTRWDTDVREPIDFADSTWQRRVQELALRTKAQQAHHFIDYFAFARGMYGQVPPLVVGRSFWDHWLVWKALSQGGAVVDASRYMVAVHQNHDYGYHPAGKEGTNEDALALRNIEMAGGRAHLRTIIHSTHRITQSGLIRRTPFRRFFQNDAVLNFRQTVVEKTFALRTRLGLRRASLRKLWS